MVKGGGRWEKGGYDGEVRGGGNEGAVKGEVPRW